MTYDNHRIPVHYCELLGLSYACEFQMALGQDDKVLRKSSYSTIADWV